MGRNVGFALDLLLSLNGKEIKAFSREHVCVSFVANKKIFVKFALLILSLDYPWIFVIKDVAKMVNT